MKVVLTLGTLVRDPDSGFVGVLLDVLPFADPSALPGQQRPQHTAFVRPVAGGVELRFPPDALVQAEEVGCRHPRLERRTDGTYCGTCRHQIYVSG